MNHLLVKNIIVAYKKNQNIQHGIKSPTGSIPKGLQRHKPFKKRIEQINEA